MYPPTGEPDNPKEIAEIVSKKYNKKGYVLDFTVKSLEDEIDKILDNRAGKFWVNSEKLNCELTAYIGETLRINFDVKWKGYYYSKKNLVNFYTCKMEKNGFVFGPSHFIHYYLNNGKKSEGTFKEYLYTRDQSLSAVFQDFLGGGLIHKIA